MKSNSSINNEKELLLIESRARTLIASNRMDQLIKSSLVKFIVLRLAINHQRNNHLSKSIMYLEEYCDHKSTFSDAHLTLANLYRTRNESVAAKKLLKKGLQANEKYKEKSIQILWNEFIV